MTQGAGLSVGQENTVNELMREKDELFAEREAQEAQIALLVRFGHRLIE